MGRKRIGELLLELGAITPPELEEGLALHRSSRQRLGVTLVQRGFITEEQLAKALAEALSIPELDLRQGRPDPAALQSLRARFCESNDLFPYAIEAARGRNQLVVAMSDPLNYAAIEEIEFTTNLRVSPRVASLSSIRAAIMRHYHRLAPEDAPAGKVTIVHRGGEVLLADTGDAQAPSQPRPSAAKPIKPLAVALSEESDIVAGQPVASPKPKPPRRPAQAPQAPSGTSPDLALLFAETGDPVERLERKFWAMMRVMARKGLITKDEFLREMEEID